MKQMSKRILSMVMLLSGGMAIASTPAVSTSFVGPVTPYFYNRSQGVDIADWLSGWTNHVNLCGMCDFYGTFAIKPKYTSSFNSNQIGRDLFGVSSCNSKCGTTLNVSGSRVANRGATDLLADNFYLPTDYQSTLSFKPRIQNVLLDLNFYMGLDRWVEGLFMRVHLPVTWTRWNLNFCENIVAEGTNAYDAGYFSCAAVPRSDLNTSFATYANGSETPTIAGVTTDPLNFARIDRCSHSKSGLAELRFVLGYNFLCCEDYHLGVGLLFAAPTGTRPHAARLFEPIVGNGKHWELGAHITSHVTLWRSCDEESNLGLYVDANVTHLFDAKQCRTFDLCGKPLSRYMLAMTFTAPVGNGLVGSTTPASTTVPAVSPTAPNGQFGGRYLPVANITTQNVRVSIGVQGDVAAQLTYNNCGWAWDLGYNFWGRSCEKIRANCNTGCNTSCSTSCGTSCSTSSCSTSCCGIDASTSNPVTFAETSFALKGDAYEYGFAGATCVPLSATESLATINGGTNFAGIDPTNATAVDAARRNPGVDAPQFAFANGGLTSLSATIGGGLVDQTRTSVQPVYIRAADLANCNGTKGSSNKIYTNLSYQWLDCECWAPYLGVGAFGEFGNNKRNCGSSCSTNCGTSCDTSSTSCNTSCNTGCSTSCGSNCLKVAVSQWGVWVKGGVSFN